MRIPNGEWELVCSADVFAGLRADPEFAMLLTVARIVNAVKFGVQAHRDAGIAHTPAAERQRIGAQLLLAGLLHEVLEFQKRAGKDWGELEAFKSVFAVFNPGHLDAETVGLLDRMRNRAAFHFDAAVAARSLPKMPVEPFAFLVASGADPMQANYELADLVTFGFVFNATGNVQRLGAGLPPFRRQLDALLSAFVRNADQVIFKHLVARGFTIVERPPGSFAADRTDGE